MTDYSKRTTSDSRFADPFWWWGPGWTPPAARKINDLMGDGTIDPWTTANLWAALARRRSMAVVAGPSGVGKTTLLTALLDFLPLHTRRIYPRGCFETFAFLTDPATVPGQTALLINEISPHLPVYLWGPAVGRMLEAVEKGYTLLATAHASSIHEFVGMFTGSPLRLPASLVAAFEFVIVMEHSAETSSGRRVQSVWRLQRTTMGVELNQLGETSDTTSDYWFPIDELNRRREALAELHERSLEPIPVVCCADTCCPDAVEP